MCHRFPIFGPACLKPGTGILPSSQQQRSFCLQMSSKASYRRHRWRTGYSRSCLLGASHMCGSPLCRNCQRGASFGRRARPVLTRQPISVDCRWTHLAAAGRPAEAPWGEGGGVGEVETIIIFYSRPVRVKHGVLESDVIHRGV